MLKKLFLSIGMILGFIILMSPLRATDAFIEGKAAYFYPTDHQFRKIYSGGGIYGLELTCQAWRHLYAWASADCFYQTGKSIGEKDSTHITFVPLGQGLKYLFPVSFVDIYVGAGILETWAHIKDHSRYVIRSNTKWGIGGIAKIGALFNINKHFFIDVFTNYSYTKIDFHKTNHGSVIRHDADLSGFWFGGALGYRFGSGRPTKKMKTIQPTNKKVSLIEIEPPRTSDFIGEETVIEDPI